MRALPYYLSVGMSPRDFWELPVDLCAAYRAKAEIDAETRNSECWQMGAYVYDTMIRVSPAYNPFSKAKVADYVSLPYGKAERVEEERRKAEQLRMEKGRAFMEVFAINFNEKKRSRQGEAVGEPKQEGKPWLATTT